MSKSFLTGGGKGKGGSKGAKKSVAPEAPPAVTSETNVTTAVQEAPPQTATTRSMKMAELVLTRSTADRKSKRLVIYNFEGRKGSVQFLSTLFGGDQKSVGNPPDKLTLIGEFAEPKVAKPKETPEERKARLAALPKPTLAEKVAKAEERAAKLREKLAKAKAEAVA